MKRKHTTTSKAGNRPRAVDASRLAIIRGGSGLGIAVDVVPPPPPPIMEQQHSEMLVRI